MLHREAFLRVVAPTVPTSGDNAVDEWRPKRQAPRIFSALR